MKKDQTSYFKLYYRLAKHYLVLLDCCMNVYVGTCEEKLQLLFKMYDKDESGSLSREEVSNLIK